MKSKKRILKKITIMTVLALVLSLGLCACGESYSSSTSRRDSSNSSKNDSKEEEVKKEEDNTTSKEDSKEEKNEYDQAEVDYLYDLIQVLPTDNNYEDEPAYYADFLLLNLHELNLEGDYCKDYPKLETGSAVPDFETSGWGYSGEGELDYFRVSTKEMEKFVSDIFAVDFKVPEGELNGTDNRNEKGYVWEWGYSYITAMEGIGIHFTGMDAVLTDKGYAITYMLTISDPSEEVLYKVSTVWERNKDSVVGFTQVSCVKEEVSRYSFEEDEEVWDDSDNSSSESDIDVDAYVKQIREWYYNPTDADTSVTKKGGSSGYTREYSYHNGDLCFAFIHKGSEEHRLYYSPGAIIRYIGPDGKIQNLDDINVPDEIIDLINEDN